MAKPTAAELQKEREANERKRKAQEEETAAAAKKKLTDKSFDLTAALKTTTLKDNDQMTRTTSVISDVAKKINGLPVIRISDLTLATTNRSITAKITGKSFRRAFPSGQMFSFDLTDSSGTIRTTVFSQVQTFEQLYNLLQIDMNVNLGGFQVAKKNDTYNKLTGDFELKYMDSSTLAVVDDSPDSCPPIQLKFVKFDQIKNFEANSIIDVIGIITECSDLQEVTNGPLRRVTLVDDSGSSVMLLLWKFAALEVELERGTTLAIKSVILKQKTYQGVTSVNLGLTSASAFWPTPRVAESDNLMAWMNSTLAQ